MTKFVAILTSIVICFSSAAFAQNSGFGLGVIFGEQTGLSFKNWTGGTSAIAGGIAWKFGARDTLHLHADYLIHNFNFLQVETGELPLYYGIGARVKFEESKGKGDNNQVGVRVPVGINYIFAHHHLLDVFFEVVPTLDFAPSTAFDLSGGIGIRYFF